MGMVNMNMDVAIPKEYSEDMTPQKKECPTLSSEVK